MALGDGGATRWLEAESLNLHMDESHPSDISNSQRPVHEFEINDCVKPPKLLDVFITSASIILIGHTFNTVIDLK